MGTYLLPSEGQPTNIEDFLNKSYNLHAFEQKIDVVLKHLMQQSKIPWLGPSCLTN